MRVISEQEWQERQVPALEMVQFQQWVRAPGICIHYSPNLDADAVRAVESGIRYCLQAIGLRRDVILSPTDQLQAIQEINPSDPISTTAIDENLPFSQQYVRFFLTRNNGILHPSYGQLSSLAISDVHRGRMYLAVPLGKQDFAYVRLLAAHEAGHVLGLQLDHHDLLSQPSEFIIREGPRAGEKDTLVFTPYQVEGDDPQANCVMLSSIKYGDSRQYQRTFCPRFVRAARLRWGNLERIIN